MVLVFHHVIIFFLLSDWLIQILPPFWFCCDVACFCFGSETQLKCTYRRCCQFFKNIVLCLDVLSGRESASMATFFFMTLLLFSRMLGCATNYKETQKRTTIQLWGLSYIITRGILIWDSWVPLNVLMITDLILTYHSQCFGFLKLFRFSLPWFTAQTELCPSCNGEDFM